MGDSGAFCPSCGEPVPAEAVAEAGRREDALCDACYLERFELVDAPEAVTVEVCGGCGAVRREGTWTDLDGRDYTDVAIDAVSAALGVHVDADGVGWGVEAEQVDPTTIRLHCTFDGVVRGRPIQETVTVPATLVTGTCSRCGRIAGDAYAGIVQVRADGRDPTAEETGRAVEIANEVVEAMAATGDRDAFITDVGAVDGGLDVKVSTNKIGEKIANRIVEAFGGSVSSSETLVTEDGDGRGVYRVSFAVRLPRFRPGTVIDPGDGEGPVLVRGVRGNLKGRRLATGEPFEAPPDVDADRLGRVEDAAETTVVTVEDARAVQVLDPETYDAKTIPRPTDFDDEAETVRVLKSRAGLHVVPGGED